MSAAQDILAMLSGLQVDLELRDGKVVARDRSTLTNEIREIVRENIADIREELDVRQLASIARRPRVAVPVLAEAEDEADEGPASLAAPWWEDPAFSLPSWLAELDAVGVDVAFDPPRLMPRTTLSVPAWVCSDFLQLVLVGAFARERKAA
jgi:hypothetical protein